MGLNEAIKAALKLTAENGNTLCLSRHETDKVLEALPVLVKAKKNKLKSYPRNIGGNVPRLGRRLTILTT